MENKSWNLEDFIDSLVVELDKTRETLAVKAINKPLTYTVKDMAMDLNIFPTYDGDQVKFTTAQPGQEGASKVTIQLGSITDQQVRATSKPLTMKKEMAIKDIQIDNDTRKELRKIGVTTVEDLQSIEKKNIDIEKISKKPLNYSNLLNQIKTSKRNATPPKIKSVGLSLENEKVYMTIIGENLAVNSSFKPVAVVNDQLANVENHNDKQLKIQLGKQNNITKNNELILTLDPYAVIKLNVKA